MKKIQLNIPAMQSMHCRDRVKASVDNLKEIKIVSVQPGILNLEIADDNVLKDVYTAVQSVGYEIMGVDTEETGKENGKMRTFKSNINCMGCVEKVAPALTGHDAIESWRVDTESKDKTLTIESNGISDSEIISLIESRGFKAEKIINA